MEDSVQSILSMFGKDVEDEDVLYKIESIRAYHNFTSSDMADFLLAYMNSDNIKCKLNLEIISNFEKQINMKSNIESNKYKSCNIHSNEKLLQSDMSFLGDYIDNDENMNTTFESILNVSTINTLIDKENVWDVKLCTERFNSKILFQKNVDMRNVIDIQGKEVIESQLQLYNESLNENGTKLNFTNLYSVGNNHFEDIYTCGRLTLDQSQTGLYDADNLKSLKFDDEYHGLESVVNNFEKLTTKNIAIQNYSGIGISCESLVLDETDSYSLFLGQNIIVKGKNPSNSGFFVSSVVPRFIKATVPIKAEDILNDLQIVIACGPFTNRTNDHIDPLKRLMQEIKTNRCHVLILIGPVVDTNNLAEQNSDEPFEKVCWDRLKYVAKCCADLQTHLVIVPSIDDATEIPIFPQPGFSPPPGMSFVRSHLIHFVPNPAIIKIGPYVFGISSADILRHLSTQEISKNCSTPRIKRLCEHILAENNFYPLKPAHPELSIDWSFWFEKCGFGSSSPHCLILPSKLNTFLENVNGVSCINPGYAKSTYCRLDIFGSQVRTESINNIVDISQCNFLYYK